MAKIKFIRIYEFYDSEWCDILYESNRLCTMPVTEMPKTAKAWLANKTGIEQYDRTLKINEIIYK